MGWGGLLRFGDTSKKVVRILFSTTAAVLRSAVLKSIEPELRVGASRADVTSVSCICFPF